MEDYTTKLISLSTWSNGRMGLDLDLNLGFALLDSWRNSCRELENKPRHLSYITVSITAKFNTNEEAEFLRPYFLLAALNTDHCKIKLMSL